MAKARQAPAAITPHCRSNTVRGQAAPRRRVTRFKTLIYTHVIRPHRATNLRSVIPLSRRSRKFMLIPSIRRSRHGLGIQKQASVGVAAGDGAGPPGYGNIVVIKQKFTNRALGSWLT